MLNAPDWMDMYQEEIKYMPTKTARKIGETGSHHNLYLTLPKNWTTQSGIIKGDTVQLLFDVGILVVMPRRCVP